MGLLLQDARLLLGAGLEPRRALTLGRQRLYFAPAELEADLRARGHSESAILAFLAEARHEGFAEPFLRLLGAREVDSLDASAYEGATQVHDLNVPIAPGLRERYDLVLDGGTLEHVFNFPQAIRNAMELTAPGGSLVLLAPANNFFGHGFYQFSPELFYNILSGENGFRVERLVAHELSPAHRMFDVADPSVVRARVTLTNAWPVLLFVHARREKVVPLFVRTPQQSDYATAWKDGAPVPESRKGLARLLGQRFTKGLPDAARGLKSAWNLALSRGFDFRDRRFFKRVTR